jgi:DNA polymerase-4/DNA polymerase V
MIRSWPRAIAHVDGDAFFASVEQAVHPEYKGKPVITGVERGIVAAASYEAKAMGVMRRVPLHEVRRICPQCIMLPSDYETYSLYSGRICAILKRYSPLVEWSSIDEGFCDLTGLRRLYHADYRGIAALMQAEVERELDITVSIGVSLSKSLAKLCSKFRKPKGLTAVSGKHIHLLLARTPLEAVWGFGPNSVALLQKYGLKTALDFVMQPEHFAKRFLGKIGGELWGELRGEDVYKVSGKAASRQLSISKTKTFTPPSNDRDYVWARALRNLESACIKARRHGLAARGVSLSLRSQDFDHVSADAKHLRASACTNDISPVLFELFRGIYRVGVRYRATGVVLLDLVEPSPSQFTLFEDVSRVMANERLFAAVDEAATKYGKHTVFLADCAKLTLQHKGGRGRSSQRKADVLKGENFRQHLGLPILRHKL